MLCIFLGQLTKINFPTIGIRDRRFLVKIHRIVLYENNNELFGFPSETFVICAAVAYIHLYKYILYT